MLLYLSAIGTLHYNDRNFVVASGYSAIPRKKFKMFMLESKVLLTYLDVQL